MDSESRSTDSLHEPLVEEREESGTQKSLTFQSEEAYIDDTNEPYDDEESQVQYEGYYRTTVSRGTSMSGDNMSMSRTQSLVNEATRLLEYLPGNRLREILEPYLGEKASKSNKACMWASLLLVICGFVVLIMVGGRSVAQKSVNDATLELSSAVLKDFTDTGFTSSMKVYITNHSSFSAWISPAILTMNFNQHGFGTVPAPRVDAKAGKRDLYSFPDQPVTVINKMAFDEVSTALMSAKTYDVTMTGDLTAHGSYSRPFPLHLEKTMHMIGMDNFPTSRIWKISPKSVNALKGSADLELMVDMYNPTVIGFEDFVHLNLDIFYEDVKVGLAKSLNTTLPMVQGWNTFHYRATISQNFGNVGKVLDMLKKFAILRQDVPMQLRGRDDSCPFPILQNAVSGLDIAMVLPPLPISFNMGHRTKFRNVHYTTVDGVSQMIDEEDLSSAPLVAAGSDEETQEEEVEGEMVEVEGGGGGEAKEEGTGVVVHQA